MTIHLIEQDKKERLLALDASQSFIVQAPAGSGKTELLIQRFLSLLKNVKHPEEVIAITFTKKAANEMRARVIKALKQAQVEIPPESEHAQHTWQLAHAVLQCDKKFGWNLIDNPNQLRIQTIDSLCAYLTKQLPILAHFGSQPAMADDPYSLYREAVREVLTHVEADYEWSQAIAKLLLHLDNDLNKLHDLLINLLAKRDQWLPYLQISLDDKAVRNKLQHSLNEMIIEELTIVEEHFPAELMNELISIARFAADNIPLHQTESPLLACRHLSTFSKKDANAQSIWLGLAHLLLTKTYSWRKRLDKEIGFPALSSLKNPQEKFAHTEYRQRLTMLLTQLNENEALRVALTELFFLPESTYDDAQWDILKSLLQVLKIATAQLRVSFQAYGNIDFIENVQAALLALGEENNPTDLALALDYQMKHILIDEFQDTSFTQYQLLEKLTLGWEANDGRTLFIVGDPMQSIYRFREAEVGLFIRLRESGIGNIKLIPLTLSVNFRSTPTLVNWNNTHFQRIFPSRNDITTGAVTYSHSVAKSSAQNDMISATHVHVHGFLNTKTAQADHIVRLISQTIMDFPDEKIAILVRSRMHLATLIPALKRAKIPFHAVDIDPLASRQIIQDLLSLTCALLHPADRIAWLALLRAPWCGLTLADLWILTKDHPHATIYELLNKNDIIKELSADGQKRLARITPLLKIKIAERERSHLRAWIENTWIELGGPACLQDINDLDEVNAYFNLLDNFNQHSPILDLDKIKEKIQGLYAHKIQANAHLQIMTIHAAKGLEFDTVILPHLERKMSSDDRSLLLWMEQPLMNNHIALLLAPIHATGNEKDKIYEYINRKQKIRSDYETDRLLYVASTRAKKRLHLLFNINQNEQGQNKIEPGSFLNKLWPLLEKHQDQIIFSEENNIQTELNATTSSRYTRRLISTWVNSYKKKLLTTPVLHQQSDGFQLVEDYAKLIGIVVHRLLQRIAENSFVWWEKLTDQKIYIQHQLTQAGILPHQLPAAIKQTMQIIKNTLTDPRGKWLLHPHHDAKSELALTALINGKLENLVLDRTFMDEHGTRWIIDYKTTTFSQKDLTQFLEHEQKKYAEKMHLYAKALQLIAPHPIKLGLYFPALPAWREWDAE